MRRMPASRAALCISASAWFRRDIDAAVDEAERAGGKLLRRGEFSPGYPYAYVADPDGYEVEIWYE